MYKKYIKRVLDILLSLSVLILFSPLLLFTAILVRIKLGAPVLFSQERPGYRGKIFRIYKFRSMSDCRMKRGSPPLESSCAQAVWMNCRRCSISCAER